MQAEAHAIDANAWNIKSEELRVAASPTDLMFDQTLHLGFLYRPLLDQIAGIDLSKIAAEVQSAATTPLAEAKKL